MDDRRKKADSPKEVIIAGRKFNPEDPQVWDQVREVFEPTARNAGRLAQENDKLRKEIEQSRSYKLSGSSKDVKEVIVAVNKMAEEGADIQDINKMWAEFHDASVREAISGNEFDIMWSDYLNLRTEVRDSFRDKADEEITKDLLKRNHAQRLDGLGSKQFEYLDQYFDGRIRSRKEAQGGADDIVASTGDSYNVGSADRGESSRRSASKQEIDESELDKHIMDDFLKSGIY